MKCGFGHSSRNSYTESILLQETVLHTEYSGSHRLPIRDGTVLETYSSNIYIKVIDIQEHGLDYNQNYSMSYLRSLKGKIIYPEQSYFENDVIFHIHEYIEFLKDHNMRLYNNEIYALVNADMESNAFWNGSYLVFSGMTQDAKPLVSAAIIGHELTHALIQNICNLDYQGQSGALNESYADIFGVMFEFYLKEKHKGIGFELGNECYKDGHSMRSFENPNSRGQPDKMYGLYWSYSGEDNGGVHTNSGVINHLFYILQKKYDRKSVFILFVSVLYRLKHDSTFYDFKDLLIKKSAVLIEPVVNDYIF